MAAFHPKQTLFPALHISSICFSSTRAGALPELSYSDHESKSFRSCRNVSWFFDDDVVDSFFRMMLGGT